MFATEFLDLPPLASAGGMVTLPGSKSISNRVLLLSALCAGTTTLHDLLDSDDTRVMLDALRTLGCAVQRDGDRVSIGGLDGQLPNRQADLFLGNAGTAMRPLTAALAVLGGDFSLRGVARMHERPIGDLVDALRQLGCQIDYLDNPGYPPLAYRPGGRRTLRCRSAAPIRVRGDVSSQFLTALLMALPLVAAQDVVIDVVGELISRPYIAITLNLLARFGVHGQARRLATVHDSRREAELQSPGDLFIEADASSASYFIALGAIAPSNGVPLRIQGVGADSIQGDIRFIEAARLMGASVTSGPNWLEVSGPGAWPEPASSRPGLQPHTGRGHDAGRDGLVRQRYQHLAQHRQLARQGDRPHRGDDDRTAQVRRRCRGGPRLHPHHATRERGPLARSQRGHL